jgi:hypothetical protein
MGRWKSDAALKYRSEEGRRRLRQGSFPSHVELDDVM